MTVAYATVDDLVEWLPASTPVPADAERMLLRATEVLDGVVSSAFWVNTGTSLPYDSTVAAALQEAVCAQVEFWLEVGEANDVDGLAGTDVNLAGYQGRRPPRIAPRARLKLDSVGLLAGVLL